MIPKTAEYALRAMVFLAQDAGAARGSDEIAEATRVPRRYLSKVLRKLVDGEMISSRPGPNGGYRLARAASQYSVLDVISVVEPMPRIRTCPLDIPSHGTNLCPLHRELDCAYAHMEEALGHVTLAELLDREGGSVPLCACPQTSL